MTQRKPLPPGLRYGRCEKSAISGRWDISNGFVVWVTPKLSRFALWFNPRVREAIQKEAVRMESIAVQLGYPRP